MAQQYPCGALVELADGRRVHVPNVHQASMCKRGVHSFVVITHPGKEATVIRNAVSLTAAEPQDLAPWCAP